MKNNRLDRRDDQGSTYAGNIHTSSFFAPAALLLVLSTLIKEKDDTLVTNALQNEGGVHHTYLILHRLGKSF